jgi:hypothetical protein
MVMAFSDDCDDGKITISKTEYQNLVYASNFLQALEAAGVDNWEGYEHACQEVSY